MHEDLIQKLNKLKAIRPDENYVLKTKRTILALDTNSSRVEEERKFKFIFKPMHAFSGAFAVIAVAFLAFYLFNSGSGAGKTASLDPQNLLQEINGLSAGIEVGQLSYQDDANQTIASALNEITNTKTRHLSNALLQNEEDGLNLNDSTNPQIDNLLNQVVN